MAKVVLVVLEINDLIVRFIACIILCICFLLLEFSCSYLNITSAPSSLNNDTAWNKWQRGMKVLA